MLKIAICDDEIVFQNELSNYISDYLNKRKLAFQIDTFSSGEEFIALGTDVLLYNIVFLDINMREMDGIMVAKKLREISHDIFIVFVTAYLDYTLEGYKVEAVRYLLKDMNNLPGVVEECLDAIIEKMNYALSRMNFEFNEGKKEISLEDLLYIESRLHKLEFYVMESDRRVYTMYALLNDFEQKLQQKGFVRTHQSYLVNLKYINSVANYKVGLKDGTELTIPKTRYKKVKETFIAYQGEF